MHYLQWYESVLEKVEQKKPIELWLHAMWFSGVVWLACVAYILLRGDGWSITSMNHAFSNAGMLLIGFSFALSGLCYFWNFMDTKIIYRRYIGLMGFYFITVHVGLSVALLRLVTDFGTYYSVPTNVLSNGFAVLAFLILLLMASISNQFAMHELGTAQWRALLRTGYLAYVFAVIHFSIKRYDEWVWWLNNREPMLPPISLVILVVAVCVLLLRIMLWLSVRRHNQSHIASQ